MTDRSNSSAIPPRPESLNPQHITDMARAIAPVPLRPRADGWSPEKQVAFIEALAACGCVAEAAARVGMSARSAYTLRARPGARSFREAWDVAQDSAVERLSDAMFGRALHGVARPVFYQGEQIGERRYYDERLAMFILSRRAPDRYGEWIDRREVRRDHDETGAALGEALARVEEDALWEEDARDEAGRDGDARGPDEGDADLSGDGPYDAGLYEDGFGYDEAPPERPPLPRPVYMTEQHAEERRQIVQRVPSSEEVDALLLKKIAILKASRARAAQEREAERSADGGDTGDGAAEGGQGGGRAGVAGADDCGDGAGRFSEREQWTEAYRESRELPTSGVGNGDGAGDGAGPPRAQPEGASVSPRNHSAKG